jgi:hypothetical protein
MTKDTKKTITQSIKAGLIHSFKIDSMQFNVIPNNIYYMIEKLNNANDKSVITIID